LSADKKKEKCPEPLPTGNFIFSASGIVLFFGGILDLGAQLGWSQEREKIDWQEAQNLNLIVGWCGRFLFFVVSRQFTPSKIGEWQENQILIPGWTYFHCPGATLAHNQLR